ncbi:MAG TPA: tetratricopeptide repeat protein [Blastocatellia bacterium]|nr:tetratricopeptide repeat protein [Blastocatellia bacterium]
MSAHPVQIGQYEIVEPLGEGGMGVVYRARSERDGSVVALKTVRVRDEAQFAAIRREIYSLGLLRHPGVVRVVDSGIHNNRPWYAMDLLDGRTLREFMPGRDGSTIGLDERLRLIRRLCAPLAYLHGEGVVHCDLKPGNIFVDSDGRPVIVDFGLAARFTGGAGREALDIAEEGAGTIAYMSPEQIQGEPLDARADLYALGCILYETLTGRHVFERARPIDMAWAHLSDDPSPPSLHCAGVASEVDDLVLRLLAKRPSDRIGYAEDVAVALARIGIDGDDDGPRPRAYLYRPAFAGRESRLETLRECVSRLDSGSGGFVAVGGESGIGKTRLVAEAGRFARARGLRVLVSECRAFGGTAGQTPLGGLQPVLDAIADWCVQHGPIASGGVIGACAPVLAEYSPSFAGFVRAGAPSELVELTPDAARLRLFRALSDTIEQFAANGRPVVVILDDVQWADELTIGFLDHAARSAAGALSHVLVVATYRTDEVGPDLEQLLAQPGIEVIGLDRLDEPAVASIVGGMLSLQPPPRVFSRYLARQSEGNPFFVAEYLRAAVEAGFLWRDSAGEWQVTDTGNSLSQQVVIPLPGSLRELVGRRLNDVPDDAREIVAAAAVLGRETDVSAVLGVAQISDDSAQGPIAELIKRHVVSVTPQGRLRFVHDKIREVAYAGIAEDMRPAIHARAAEAISSTLAERQPELAATLGYHWEVAGDVERARTAYLKSARAARSQYALGEADRLYRAYLSLEGSSPAESVGVRIELAHDILRLRGRTADAIRMAERAVLDAGRMGEVRLEAEGRRKLGILYWESARMDDARAAFESALTLGRQLGDETLIGVTSGNLGNVHLQQGRLDDALECYNDAIAAHRKMGDRSGEGVKIGNIAIVHYNRGQLDRAVQLYGESIAIARETGNRSIEAKMVGNLALLESDRQNFDVAEGLFAEALAVARRIGDRREEGIILGNLAVQHWRNARFDDALDANRMAMDVAREMSNVRNEGILLTMQAIVERTLGRPADAERSVDQAYRLISKVDDRLQLALVWCERGFIDLARGRSAREALARAREIQRELDAGPDSDVAQNIGQLSRACDAAENGEALFRGQCVEDLSPPILEWLQRTGELPGG